MIELGGVKSITRHVSLPLTVQPIGFLLIDRQLRTNSVSLSVYLSIIASSSSRLQKWQDIVKEVKFLHECSHDHIVLYKGCHIKESHAWVSQISSVLILLDSVFIR